ncbi:MAG TPA: cyclase family protein [Geminicoccaceae bacterium]|nr:cyclase family protein [Geminicoccaceae bacterium]
MCVPGCVQHIAHSASRRRVLTGAAAVAAAATVLPRPSAAPRAATPRSFSGVVDLTHVLTPDFPTFFGEPQLQIEPVFTWEQHRFNMNRWTLVEHTGTHMDAPIHFSEDGPGPAEIAVDRLVVPLAVIDIAARAESDPDAQLTPDDIRAFEAEHGPLPAGCCVALHSGWGRFVREPRFRNADGDGKLHFPGFHAEAARMLLEERDVAGIAVDTLSLDFGPSPDFAVHYAWLPTGRWGLEAVANLDDVPPLGATLVVGGPKVQGATGGPSRVLALI